MIKKKGKTVTFEFDCKSERKVYVAGDFNNWDCEAHPLVKKGDKWKVSLELKPGEYQFRYYSDRSWYNDWKADDYVPNPMGSTNSVVKVLPPKEAKQKPMKEKKHGSKSYEKRVD